ncbi:protein kinase [Archangium violaceum]|uniref:serine/threonine-protein kinase n=1 Tax=Archangium violaceum TaxID=83451 RepID=UPI001950D018|nr:serine/threonine-protein kinase [Archangium violaceum]QRN99462.1 protein kinase [Archangium violaceum]
MDSTLSFDSTVKSQSPRATAHLATGTVIASRFTVESQAGRGGTGSVYRARDSLTGQTVALKFLHVAIPETLQRFHREATLLASLHHPGIVSYVAHGTTDAGLPFLAMQWLEGEDLAHRLARQPLHLEEILALLRRAAEALSAAHQRGIVHRDIKPSNLLLRHGRPEDVVLLDFGLARDTLPDSAMTASHMVLGTPGYMAPEQASPQSRITPAADVFSLGCVLYECLTGQRAFSASHFAAVLAKILFAEPPPLRSARPELPSAFQELLDLMLAKDPARRLQDASHVTSTLARLQPLLETAHATEAPRLPTPHLAGVEQQLFSVMLAAPRERTTTPGSRVPLRDSLSTLLAPHGARVELLADGSLVVTLKAIHGSAVDPAALAARCALTVQERWPETSVVLTTGRGRFDQHIPVGEAMDRAGQLLRQFEQLPASLGAPVLLDEVTAGLLGSSIQVSRPLPGLFLLQAPQLGSDESRPLLGRPTPCVGREQELTLLEVAFNTCVEEPAAQAVLVTGPAGVGKSRLRHEFLRRLERRGRTVLKLLGRGDPMSAGSADGLIGQALRRLCGISGSEPHEDRKTRLLQRIGQHLPPEQAQELIPFLGELCGIPFSDEDNPRLRAARGDPRLMSTQVSRALVGFLQAECKRAPVLLVLEDLHWGDVLTLRMVDDVLRELAEHPFMVLALARPEVEQLLASYPAARRMQQVPLRGLSRKASGHLVREVLGTGVTEFLIDRLVEQAAGNALFLEELIRGVAEGRGDATPETVLAMLQARLMRLEPGARQVLLAASILGRTFWSGGARALLGEDRSAQELDGWLRQLVEWEWVEQQTTSRFPGETEYRFRHALVRDAAYGLVPDSHKPAGHQHAGLWLEKAGESDPRVLAEHAALGQQPERAIQLYTRAADQLFERHDMQDMERCMEAALGLGPTGEALVRLHALRATAAFWMDDFATLHEVGSAVLPRMKPGEARWSNLISGLCLGYGQSAQKEHLLALHRLLLDTEPEPEARSAYDLALCFMSCMDCYVGAIREADEAFERLEHMGRESIARNAIVRGWRNIAHGFRALSLTDGAWPALTWSEKSSQSFREVGAERDEVASLGWGAQALLALGNGEGAVERARQGMELAVRVGQLFGIAHARYNLMQVLADSPEPAHQEEAHALALEWVEARVPNRLHLGSALWVLARVAMWKGATTEAETRARMACEALEPFVPFVPRARWLLGSLLLSQGRPAEARQVMELALREAEAVGGGGSTRVGLLQVLAEACLAEGATPAGEEALRRALHCLRARASDIPDVTVRERFLRRVPENARVLELAHQRWGESFSS